MEYVLERKVEKISAFAKKVGKEYLVKSAFHIGIALIKTMLVKNLMNVSVQKILMIL